MEELETYHIVWLIILLFANHMFIYLFNLRTDKQEVVKKVYGLEPGAEQLKEEFRNSLITAPIHPLLILLFVSMGWLTTSEKNLSTVITSFFVMFWWTEFWFYASHRAMHTKWLIGIHKEHHRSYITNPMTAASFSLIEKTIFTLGIVGFASIYSHYLPFSFNGLCIYYVFYFAVTVLGHSNVEFRNARYPFSLMGYFINAPSYHAMHHARYVKNYGLVTSVFDRLFGTRWNDYEKVLERAANGKPLEKLSERP